MMKRFDFETIAVNKQGEKTKKQIKWMKATTSPMMWGTVGLLFFGLFAFIGAINPNVWKSAWWVLPLLEFIPVLRGYAFWKARQKLMNAKVTSALATIVYQPGQGYVAEPRVDRDLLEELPPGKYRFYYLEKENWPLCSEPLSSEAEMRANLNDAFISAFGYNKEHLENCRRQAGAGTLKTAEGVLTINTVTTSDGDGYSSSTPVSFTVGEATFDISRPGCGALIENLPYRVYYRQPEESLAKQIANKIMSRKQDFEAIEAV